MDQVNHLWIKFQQEEQLREHAVQEAGAVWTALEESQLARLEEKEKTIDASAYFRPGVVRSLNATHSPPLH